MLFLIATTLLIIVPELISSQPSYQGWLPLEFPNPKTNATACGLGTNEPAYVCDPNGLLREHIVSINWILNDAAHNSTKCPCSTYYCEHNDLWPRPKGYHIGLALVRKMRLQRNGDGKLNTPQDQGQIFANNLESAWNLGLCEEDIIIFYSHEDKVLAIYGGSTAMHKLTPYYRDLLAYRAGSRFNEGRIVEAVNRLLYDLRTVLNCETTYNEDCGLLEDRSGSSSANVLKSVTLFTVFVSIITLWVV
jgi:hypothetical protein